MEKPKAIIKTISYKRKASKKGGQKKRLSNEGSEVKEEEVEGSASKEHGQNKRLFYGGDEVKPAEVSHKKPKKERSPFKVPPSSYTADVFHIIHPFIFVLASRHGEVADDQNKIQDGKEMDQHALRAVAEIVSMEYVKMSMCLKSNKTELGYRPMHNALASGFHQLTRPSSKPKFSVSELCETCEPGNPSAQPDGGENLQDLEIEVNEAVATNEENDEDISSTESLNLQFEGDQDESANKSKKFDMCFRVVDKKLEGIDNNIVVLVVECKMGTITMDNVYQVAAYAIEFAKENLKKGRDAPIYLQVWNESKWRYGILYPRGVVWLNENKVVGTAFTSTPSQTCQKILDKKNLGRLLTQHSTVEYPNGEYLKGVLYIMEEDFSLPKPREKGGVVQAGPLLFFQSMLRIIVGDCVLEWTEEDVCAAADTRKQQLAEKMKFLSK